jgi:ligand-binding sensor domain-containing protein
VNRARPMVLAILLLGALAGVPAVHAEWVTHLYMNDIRDLAVTPDGVWCATGGGALFYDFALAGFRAWNRTADGLASDTLTAVEVLADGRIAFGTPSSGISLYDPGQGLWSNVTSLTWPIASNSVTFIREQDRWRFIGSRPLIGAGGGFVAWRDGEVREACQDGLDICGLPGWDVTAGIEHEGALWFGTWPGTGSLGGVGRLDYAAAGQWDTVSVGLPSLQVVEFAVWQDSLYCATTQGVAVWTGASWSTRSQGLPYGGAVTDLCAGPTRLLTSKSGPIAGVFEWQPSAQSWARIGPDTLNLQAYCVAEGEDGIVWAGMSALKSGSNWLEPAADGIWEYVGGTWIQHRKDGPHPVATYRALTFDERGQLWAATAVGGRGWRVARLSDGAWSFYDQSNTELSNAWVLELLAYDNRLWVGHCCCPLATQDCRLNIWDPENTSVAVHDSIFNIYDTATDDWGNVWLASWYEKVIPAAMGLFHYDRATGEYTQYSVESTGGLLSSNQVTAVEVEGRRLWIGFQGDGVTRVRLDSDGFPEMSAWSWVHYSADDVGSPLHNNSIRALAARPGEVWIGTTDGVALWEEGDAWRIFRPSPWGVPGAEVTDIKLTDDGATWVSMRGDGVTRITRDVSSGFNFQTFTAPDIVSPDAAVLAVGPNGRDLWVGTDSGLSHYIPAASATAAETRDLRVYPNPLRPACGDAARFLELPGTATRGTVLDVSGRVVARFQDVLAGDAFWDGRDLAGEGVAPGVYVIRAMTPRGWLTGRVAVLDLPCDE